MSDQEARNEFAQVLFVHFAQWSGAHTWDWQKLAHKAFDAAEQFELVATQRHNPQAAVPVDAPPVPSPAPPEPPPPPPTPEEPPHQAQTQAANTVLPLSPS